VTTSSGVYSQSQAQRYGWLAFCIEFLCGLVAIIWYAIFLAERITLALLTRLEEIACPGATSPDAGKMKVASRQDEMSTSSEPSEQVPTSCIGLVNCKQ